MWPSARRKLEAEGASSRLDGAAGDLKGPAKEPTRREEHRGEEGDGDQLNHPRILAACEGLVNPQERGGRDREGKLGRGVFYSVDCGAS